MNNTTTLFAILCALPATALADVPGDYSHAIGLGVSGKNAVVQLRLPPATYLHARSEGLHDLRVFDATGKPVPYALVQPVARTELKVHELPAAIFPVPAATAARSPDVEIRTSPDGSVTAITTRNPDPKAEHGIGALVLDLGHGASRQAIDALVFTLPQGVSNYQAQVALEVSDDLRDWDTLGYASLSWLSNGAQQTLSNDRMAFAPHAFRYARLTWRDGTPLQFAAIRALAPAAQPVAETLDTITLQPQPGRFAQDFVYHTPPAIPAERLSLSFGPGNVVMPAQLGQYVQLPARRGKAAARWEFAPALHTTFFQIMQGGATRRASDVTVGGVRASHWVLRPQSAPAAPPAMTLAWRPATLVFAATGSAPYTLHVGRTRATPAQRSLGEVAPGFTKQEVAALEQAVPGPARIQQAVAAPSAEVQQASHARKLVLWGALLLGVGMLALMAWKLASQTRDADAPPPA